MKPPRFPGTEKFRFCDKKYEQSKSALMCDDQSTTTIDDASASESYLFGLSHSLSTDSLSSCSCPDGHSRRQSKPKVFDLVAAASPALEDLISQTNLPSFRYEHNKRKPQLPISSRSRVFALTSHFGEHNDKSDSGFCSGQVASIYGKRQYSPDNEATLMLSRNRSQEGFTCASLSRSPTPSSLGSSSSGETCSSDIAPADDRRRPGHHHLHCLHESAHRTTTTNLMINSTSHASLTSDQSSSSISLTHSLRSSSCSPVDHWAKSSAANQNRLSALSQSSWEDGSDLH